MVAFSIFISVIVLQRLTELVVAKRNEKWLISQGGVEFGQKHYSTMVGMHTLFFLSLIGEVLVFQKSLSIIWPFLLVLFILTQIGRAWALFSLGRYWNTKIIVVPNARVVVKGPYRFVKHPNYLIVILEFIIVPLFFNAYITLVLFSVLNLWMLSIRISEEERALFELTSYKDTFAQRHRFLPKI